MYHLSSWFVLAAFVASAQSHGVILKAVGDKGFSQGFLVDNALARNCTDISPCQLDATIIRDAEIKQNVVNGCGRTELHGNIDIGEQTEDELAKNRITTVTKGSTLSVTIHQVNADGAGPYSCDLDQSSNANVQFVPLKVSNNVPGVNGLSQAKEQDFTIKVQLPDNMNCFGASTGDICTVRCRNNALAGPFGGCFAIQQSDGAGRTNSTPAAVDTAQTLDAVLKQVAVNKQDLDAAIAANQAAGLTGEDPGVAAISALVTTQPTATGFASTVNSASGGSGGSSGFGGFGGFGGGSGSSGSNSGSSSSSSGSNAGGSSGFGGFGSGSSTNGNGNNNGNGFSGFGNRNSGSGSGGSGNSNNANTDKGFGTGFGGGSGFGAGKTKRSHARQLN
ncbi:hypothetical protein H2203_003827 [Taxawa tesnikishii (nom. ined.)]|nr:hypothetical protein H2203_003827 [Dothideales sp. JES 119]